MNDNEQVSAQTSDSSAASAGEQTAKEILDLDGVSEFKWQGETYTPDRFTEVFQGYQKYGETSKYVDEDQRYWANVEHDIDKVLKNPARADEFRQVYPERFHKVLDKLLGSSQRGSETSTGNTGLPKEVMEKIQTLEQKLSQYDQESYQAKVEAASAKIDAILPSLLQKYEMADQDKVLLAAERILSKGGKLTDAAWERIVREEHEKTTSRADKFYQAKLKTQIDKGRKGADTGPGGATPGQAPVKPRTFAEAQTAMIESLRQRGLK